MKNDPEINHDEYTSFAESFNQLAKAMSAAAQVYKEATYQLVQDVMKFKARITGHDKQKPPT